MSYGESDKRLLERIARLERTLPALKACRSCGCLLTVLDPNLCGRCAREVDIDLDGWEARLKDCRQLDSYTTEEGG